MIYIGVTGWGDHDTLYSSGTSNSNKLKEYGAHFPIVEVDSSFYAIQPRSNIEKWVSDTPETFQFIVKTYQGMTGHQRGEIPFESMGEMFTAFNQSLTGYKEANKLALVLFQFPPWFDCKRENVDYIRWCREQMKDFPVALEFRNRSWFLPEYYERTLSFMKNEEWIHSICDEPQAGSGSIPTVLKSTHPEKTLIRFHGRNKHGWTKPGKGQEWRDVRYLYRYTETELMEWKKNLLALKEECPNLYVLFNNNSGGDAADNAKQMISLLNVEYEGLASRQLDFFS
ncbi:DUF72 domain-containing protein [Metabacillus arenae]|uniref:DUF72 domain-containing protein n=1 Tax=Metabacillus arenae TaxID=2771434 RepID=A0A926NHC5_9BACI|nr:DUF72 domain-containing protein [Metabacillus arenae]MBD1380805.1 DUF72 domain-containing protein [Metabacillus arenae]